MREPVIKRFFELRNDGTVERAYVYCQMDPCSDETTRTIVDSETDSEAWAQRHMRQYHGVEKYHFYGKWPHWEEERAWKKNPQNHLLGWLVVSGEETLDDVIKEYDLTEQEAQWLASIVSNDNYLRHLRMAGLLEMLKEGPHTAEALTERLGYKPVAALGKLKKEGRVKNDLGYWSLIINDEEEEML